MDEHVNVMRYIGFDVPLHIVRNYIQYLAYSCHIKIFIQVTSDMKKLKNYKNIKKSQFSMTWCINWIPLTFAFLSFIIVIVMQYL